MGVFKEMTSPEAHRRAEKSEESEQELNSEWWNEKIRAAKDKLKAGVQAGEINEKMGIGKTAQDFSLFATTETKKDLSGLFREEIKALYKKWGKDDYELEILLAVWDALREQKTRH